MSTRKIRAGLMSAVLALGVALSGAAMADITAKEAAEVDAQAKATLTKFKAETKGSDAALANAKGTLVCPKITKGGLVVGIEGGNCVLTAGTAKPVYYSTTAVKAALSLDPDHVGLHLALVQLYDDNGWAALANDKLDLLDRLVALGDDADGAGRVASARALRA